MSALLSDIVGNVQEIVRSEVRLAKSELKVEAVQAVRSGSFFVYGALLALYAFGLLLLGFVFLLERVLGPWIAAWVVCLVTSAVAGSMVAIGRARWKKVQLAPQKTAETAKEDVSWLKAQIK
jgi:Putative Actinobacterial Holin-X, holin superfamily III